MPKQSILIVEDNKPDVFLIKHALEMAGVEANVHVVSDGDAATLFIDAADSDDHAPRPDIVLLDLNLPRKIGDQVLRYMRESRACRDTRVLIVTSSNSDKDRALLSDLGANGYFRKPTSYSEFMKLGPIVKNLLEERESGKGIDT